MSFDISIRLFAIFAIAFISNVQAMNNNLGTASSNDAKPCSSMSSSASSSSIEVKQTEVDRKAAAELRDVREQYLLGYKLLNGDCEQNKKTGIELIKKAAEQGCAPAQCLLGYCLMNAYVIEHDEKIAVGWFKKAAKAGFAEGQCRLGQCLLFGRGIEIDIETGVKLLKKAAKQHFAEAQYCLGWCFWNGNVVTQNLKAAINFFSKAAIGGLLEPQKVLGIIYCNEGLGAQPDYDLAIYWLRQAAYQGDAQARALLNDIEQQLRISSGAGDSENPS